MWPERIVEFVGIGPLSLIQRAALLFGESSGGRLSSGMYGPVMGERKSKA